MNICIIGAGNIGTYLAAFTAVNKKNKVFLHTSKVESFADSLELVEEERSLKHNVNLYKVTNSYKEAVEEADITLVTYPSFMIEKALKEISKHVKKGSIIGIIPGFGGAEAFKEQFLEKGCTFFGSQRVPAITRLNEYGKSVALKERNPFMNLATFPKEKGEEVAKIMTDLIDIKCNSLSNYLAVTLSPSNPVFHPSRLYEMFKDYKEGVVYDKHYLFYEEWGNFASKYMLKLDEELEEVTKALVGDPSDDFERIKKRFNIEKEEELTEAISTATGFIGIKTPMLEVEGGYIPDVNSRYFTEDIEFGTCIIKGFAEIVGVKTPFVDEIITWGQNLLGKEYLIGEELIGKDAKDLLIPKNLGLNSKKEILSKYEI
ncbi:MAG: NAD/NADP octopine/nopaline dehydrogenase family protein [Clostridium sp.]|uniref:NAD/NADP octopine/nopaline dehydrogenase family protein n=1 Tax=Clostridium sp. TaxID=1506 RepID=UPI003F3F4441